MPLTVLNVAYPFAPVRPETAGGAEQVLAMLDRALTAAGHTSIVIASQGSQIRGTLLATPAPPGTLDDKAHRSAAAECSRAISQAAERWHIDLIHLHGIDFMDYLPAAGIPVVVTLHLPPGWYPQEVFAIKRPETWLHCVSPSQFSVCPPAKNMLPPVENGVPEIPHARHVRKRALAVSLGRICPEKGFHLAIDAAKRAGIDFLLAGQVYPYEAHQQYYDAQIRPRLGKHWRFIGAAAPRRKRRLLTAARCLLIPSLAPETSSLVAMEALMCGTPAVAFPAGALVDIIEPGRTGYLVQNDGEMADAIWQCRELDPETCRQAARNRFSERLAIGNYLAMYHRVAGQ